MEGETSWVSHCFRSAEKNIVYSQRSENVNKEAAAHSLDILPDDLIERILSNLPIVSIFRSGCVCKRWNEIVSSRRFVRNLSQTPRKPWYFMFTSSDEPFGYAFDPILKKWCSIELPYLETSNWFITSSCGLVCFMDNDSGSDSIDIYVCNPITHQCKLLQEPVGPGLKFSDYTALAISVDRVLHNYAVSIVKSKQVPGNFFQWELGIHVFHSETMMWANPLNEVFMGWRGGDESIICDGVLYLLIYNIGGGAPEIRHGLVTYNLVSRSSHSLLMSSFIPAPCSLTCCRLMSLKDKLILVGGIGKQDRSDIIKGIGIWALKGKGWQEIARMPHKFFQGFGELDDVFASSGTDDIIYIQSYGSPSLLLFDMNQKQWRWAQKCPVAKKFPLQLFTGFCFEPRLEIMP